MFSKHELKIHFKNYLLSGLVHALLLVLILKINFHKKNPPYLANNAASKVFIHIGAPPKMNKNIAQSHAARPRPQTHSALKNHTANLLTAGLAPTGLAPFLPTDNDFAKWRKEASKTDEIPSAFQAVLQKSDKNYFYLFSGLDSFKNELQIPMVLRRTFHAAEVKLKAQKSTNGQWEIILIKGENPYFRAFVYEAFKKELLSSAFKNSLDKSTLNSLSFTFNYLQLKSLDEPSYEVETGAAGNTMSVLVVEKLKPDEYMMIAGGINIIGIATYAYIKLFPPEYAHDPQILELKKSYAFLHEGKIIDEHKL